MLFLSIGGMAIGLRIDLQSVLPETVSTLCTQTRSFADSMFLHATLLPATNLSMFTSGIAAVCLVAEGRCHAAVFRYLGCSAAMLVGMFLSEWLAPAFAHRAGIALNLSMITAAMIAGMLAGMGAWSMALRIWWKDWTSRAAIGPGNYRR